MNRVNSKEPRKIAVVLFGQPRFIQSGLAAKGYRRLFKNVHVTYFGHCWFDEENQFQTASGWTGLQDLTIHPKAIMKIRQQFPKIELQIEKPKTFALPPPHTGLIDSESMTVYSPETLREFERLQTTPELMYSNVKSQLYSINKALKILELRNENEFDLVFLSRWDIFFRSFPNILEIQLDKLSISDHHHNFPDLFFVGPRNMVSATDAYDGLGELIKQVPTFTPELIKKMAFLSKFSDLDLKTITVDSPMIRSSKHSYTFFIQFIEKPFYKFLRLVTESDSLFTRLLRFMWCNLKKFRN